MFICRMMTANAKRVKSRSYEVLEIEFGLASKNYEQCCQLLSNGRELEAETDYMACHVMHSFMNDVLQPHV